MGEYRAAKGQYLVGVDLEGSVADVEFPVELVVR
jgi:hypothetical protein